MKKDLVGPTPFTRARAELLNELLEELRVFGTTPEHRDEIYETLRDCHFEPLFLAVGWFATDLIWIDTLNLG